MISLTMLSGVWRYRGFVLGSVRREFQSKYRNAVLGAAWTVLNPLAMILVYTVIFSQVMGNRLPGNGGTFAYSIYLCAGVLTWGLFAEITSRSQGVFIENANLIKKLQFPRLCLPIIVVLNALVNFGIIFGLFTAFLIASGNFPGWVFLAIVPVLLLQILFAIGLGMILGVLNVFFRDVGQFFTIVLQFWFWFTPIVYPVSALPAGAGMLSVLSVALTSVKPLLCVFCTSAEKLSDCSVSIMCSVGPETAEPTRGSSPASRFFTTPSSTAARRMPPLKFSEVTSNSMPNRCLFSNETMRRLRTRTLRPCGEVHSTVRVSTPVRKSSTRS